MTAIQEVPGPVSENSRIAVTSGEPIPGIFPDRCHSGSAGSGNFQDRCHSALLQTKPRWPNFKQKGYFMGSIPLHPAQGRRGGELHFFWS